MAIDGDTPSEPGLFGVPFGIGTFNSGSFPSGKPPLTVDFSVPEQRKAWLKDQSSECLTVLAARAALRTLSNLTIAFGPNGSRLTRRKTILRTFRAVASVWAVSAYPGQLDVLRDAARGAVGGLGNLKLAPPERSAAYALATLLAPSVNASARASTAISYALDAAGEKGQAAFNDMLDAITTDADLLSQQYSAVTIAHSQLWPGRGPAWAQQNWVELKSKLLAANEDWDVWVNWYEARLSGEPTNEKAEFAIITMGEELWQLTPREVNGYIGRLHQELRETTVPATSERLLGGVGIVAAAGEFGVGNRSSLSGTEINVHAGELQGVRHIGLLGEEKPQEARGGGAFQGGAFQGGAFNTVPYNTTPYNGGAARRARTLVGEVGINATAEVVPNAIIEAVVSQIKSEPRVFEEAARFAARSIDLQLKTLAARIPNEPGALDGYEKVRTALEELKSEFEVLASSVHEASEVTDAAEQTTLFRKAVLAGRAISEGFVGWLHENGNKAGRVIAELGLAGVISGTLSYYVGVPPVISFSVTVAAMEGKSIWDAIVLFAPERKQDVKSD